MCIRLSSFVGLLYCAVVTYFDVSEERTVSIYSVTESVRVDAEVRQEVGKNVWHVGRFQVIWPNWATDVGKRG
jgi:hypothetical protein